MAQDESSRRTHTIRVATYNIHRGRGLDGRTRLERIAAVLATIDADVVALQEVVGASPLKPGQAAELGSFTCGQPMSIRSTFHTLPVVHRQS